MPKKYICAPFIDKKYLPRDTRLSKIHLASINIQQTNNSKTVIQRKCVDLQFGTYCGTSTGGPKNDF